MVHVASPLRISDISDNYMVFITPKKNITFWIYWMDITSGKIVKSITSSAVLIQGDGDTGITNALNLTKVLLM